jgi:hypothetical protein
MRERLLGQAGTNLAQAGGAAQQIAPVGQAAQSLFNLGQGYLAESPQAAAQRVMQQQQALLQPGREQQLAQLTNQQFQQGRLGLGVGGTLAQQDAQLAAQAMQQGQQQTTFGAGLFNTGANLLGQIPQYQVAALAPYTQYMAGAAQAEALGQNPFDVSTALGAKQASAGTNVAQALQSAAQQASARQAVGAQMKQQAVAGGLAGLADPVSQLIGSLVGNYTTNSVLNDIAAAGSLPSPSLDSSDSYYQYLQDLGVF